MNEHIQGYLTVSSVNEGAEFIHSKAHGKLSSRFLTCIAG